MPDYLAWPHTVRWSECDPAGIAYYPRFFEWMDAASHVLTREMGISGADMLPPSRLAVPLAAVRADFLAPVNLDDEVEVRLRVTRLGRTSFSVRHEIVRRETGAVLVRGQEDRVYVGRDAAGGLVPMPLTDAMRAVLARYAEEPPTVF